MTDEENKIKDYERYLKIKDKIKDRKDRTFLINFLLNKGFEEGRKETGKQWKSCFLSCSSPYCAGHFPAVKMQGELGNMSKGE